jgi:hypothetical protein
MFRIKIAQVLPLNPPSLRQAQCPGEMKKSLLLYALVLSLLSCSNKKEEVVSFDDISKSSDRYKEGHTKKDSIARLPKTYDLLSHFSKTWVDSLAFEKENIYFLDTTIFSDRFGAKKTEKWYFKSEKDSLVFMHWEFKDSIKAQNSFFNWLDCFGPSCKSIMIGQEVKLSKRSLTFLLQNNHLFSIESNAQQDVERYLNLFDNLRWNKTWKYIMIQAPRKKGTWFYRNADLELINIKN